ncbi:hypothetical protein [Ereboglobus sp. PH5-10]|uniref:hypothetical protein n=1 Tax=Ereboglobus sp. PH5-10 TaxID=2940629 RepID=UPI0024057DD3|nr:hypothetical protein [Ereboglobus sp. PH5-10]
MAATSGALRYLENQEHHNHRFYHIDHAQVFGAENAQDFETLLDEALRLLNMERAPSNQIRTAATWWIAAFAPGSYLDDFEKSQFLNVILRALDCFEFCVVTWHIHKFSGAADLNLIIPHITLGDRPALARPSNVNLIRRARHRADEWQQEVSETRQDCGEFPIPAIGQKRAWHADNAPAFTPLVNLIGDTIRNTPSLLDSPMEREKLPRVFVAAGLHRDEWEIDSNFQFYWTPPGRRTAANKPVKAQPPLEISLPYFLGFVERYLAQFASETQEDKFKNRAKTWRASYISKNPVRRDTPQKNHVIQSQHSHHETYQKTSPHYPELSA